MTVAQLQKSSSLGVSTEDVCVLLDVFEAHQLHRELCLAVVLTVWTKAKLFTYLSLR